LQLKISLIRVPLASTDKLTSEEALKLWLGEVGTNDD